MPRHGQVGYHQIASRLRDRWLADWKPGLKLPKYEVLRKQLDTSQMTLQRSMDLLSDQGFIITRPTVGSYLAEYPPDRYRIGLVFPGHPEDIFSSWLWSRYSLAMFNAAESFNTSQDRWQIVFYMDVSPERGGKGLMRLRRDLESKALAGLIFSYSPHELLGMGILESPTLPIIYVNRNFQMPGMFVESGKGPFLDNVVPWIREKKFSRIAVLSSDKAQDPNEICRLLETVGLEVRPEWIQGTNPFEPQWLPNLIAAMFCRKNGDRPDVLIISDDHLVEPTVDALSQMPESLREGVSIVGHWNFPLIYKGRLNIQLFGNDAEEWLKASVMRIEEAAGNPVERGEIKTVPLRKVFVPGGNLASDQSRLFIEQNLRQAKEQLSQLNRSGTSNSSRGRKITAETAFKQKTEANCKGALQCATG